MVQWIAAGTAIFVASVGYFQWRTAQQKSALDLFERRLAIYNIVRKAVSQMASFSPGFDQGREAEFMETMERAYFFFGDDVTAYIKRLWSDILAVREVDAELRGTTDLDVRRKQLEKRHAALSRISAFYTTGQPLFARYMRFSQTVRGIW